MSKGKRNTVVYTRESDESLERARADLNVPDPSAERANAVLAKPSGPEAEGPVEDEDPEAAAGDAGDE